MAQLANNRMNDDMKQTDDGSGSLITSSLNVKNDVDLHAALCLCGKKFKVLLAKECYDGTGVQCDSCEKMINNNSRVYHCPSDKNNILHQNGYDVCVSCYNKMNSDEYININTILFEIWFIINKLNKSIIPIMISNYEINSVQSLISKSSYVIFNMVNSINWDNNNNNNNIDNRKIFYDKYDEMKEHYNSLQNKEKLDALKRQLEQAQRSSYRNIQSNNSNNSYYSNQSYNYSNSSYNNSNYSNSRNHARHTNGAPQMLMSARPARARMSMNSSSSVAMHSSFHSVRSLTSSTIEGIDFASNNYNNNNSNSFNNNNKNIGFSLGGAKDISSFRLNIKNHIIPQSNSITFEGIFGEYYFDTNSNSDDTSNDVEMKNNTEGVEEDEEQRIKAKEETELPIFYASYSYSKSKIPKSLKSLKLHSNNHSNSNNNDTLEYEHYLTIGLNSNIKERDFARKKLNLIIVLDISGSMQSSFSGSWAASKDDGSKMKIARECILLLLTHLNHDDRFGLILFNNSATVQIPINQMCSIKFEEFENINKIEANGGTNMESGYNAATSMFYNLGNNVINDPSYENRMIFLTDARPNDGARSVSGLMKLVKDASDISVNNSRIYTTFVGIGVDFNSNLISDISKVRGCNYFSVDSKKSFMKKLDSEFDYFVSPMVFNLKLTLFCEGSGNNVGCIDKVFGDGYNNSINIENGEIMRIDTLFPSPPSDEPDNNDIKGGIVLIKLKNEYIESSNKQYFIQTQFEDKFGKKYDNMEPIEFNNNNSNNNNGGSNVAIDSSYYANLGVRKGLLLVRYVLLVKQWIDRKGNIDGTILKQFQNYFENEMKYIKDDSLKQEIEIIDKLINW